MFSCDFHLGFHPLSPPDFEWCFGLRHTSHPSDGKAFQLPPIGNTEPFNSWNSCAGTKRHRHPHRSLLGSGLTKREVYYPCATTHVLMRTTDLQGYSLGEYPSINGSPFCWCFPIKKKKAKQKSKKAKQTFKTRHWKRMIPSLSHPISHPVQLSLQWCSTQPNKMASRCRRNTASGESRPMGRCLEGSHGCPQPAPCEDQPNACGDNAWRLQALLPVLCNPNIWTGTRKKKLMAKCNCKCCSHFSKV